MRHVCKRWKQIRELGSRGIREKVKMMGNVDLKNANCKVIEST